MKKTDNIYTPKELAEILPIGLTTIYRMIRCGEIKASRIGGKKLAITQKEVDRLLEPQEDIRVKRKRRK